MERAQFEETVKSLEAFSANEPEKYRQRVGMLAALGYGYVLFVLLAVLVMLGVLIWIMLVGHHLNALLVKLGFFLLIFAFIVLRSLWVRFPPPSGIVLTREKVPKLFEVIDDMTTRLQAPPFHHVILNDEFNAAVMQLPRLGLLGWQKNYLLLGLPLMQALSAEEFNAVVAHELGHLSGSHGKFGGWIYRINQTWAQLQVNFAQAGHGGGWVFEKFLNWYSPYFGAYSFVLRRADEYVADRCSAELTSPATAASALVGVSMKGRYIEELFWPEHFKKVVESPEAPSTTFSDMASTLRAPFARKQLQPETSPLPDQSLSTPPVGNWLARAFRDKTDYADTHPSLTDRLKALGVSSDHMNSDQPEQSQWLSSLEHSASTPSAASHYFGAGELEFTQQLDKQWQQAVGEQWKLRYELVQKSKVRLKELEDKAQNEALSVEELWEQVTITRNLNDDEAAFPLIQQVLALQPNHAAANFVAGQILLERGDDMGIENLLCAARLDSEATLASYGTIYNFLMDQAREEEAKEYRERAYGFHDEIEKAMEERARISDRDEFLPPSISAENLAQLKQLLQSQKHIAQAHLACKKVEHLNDKPLHVLGLTRAKTSTFKLAADNEKVVNDFIALLQNWEDHPIGYVFVMDASTKKMAKKIEAVPEALIYSSTL